MSSIAVLCRKLFVTPGGYHAWLNRTKSQHSIDDDMLLAHIIRVHKDSDEVYGYPRVHQALINQGIKCGRNRIARLMRENGIIAKMARRFKRHKHKHEHYRSTTNLLLDIDHTTAKNQVWVADVTFIRVGRHWSYLSTAMDRHTREIIGWSFSDKNDTQLVKESLLMATSSKENTPQTIFHTDQGSNYLSKQFRKTLTEQNLRISTSRKGHCWDNAFMESFYHSLKTEMVYFMKFKHLLEAITHIMNYISFYNYKRLHSGIGYITPFQMAKLAV